MFYTFIWVLCTWQQYQTDQESTLAEAMREDPADQCYKEAVLQAEMAAEAEEAKRVQYEFERDNPF